MVSADRNLTIYTAQHLYVFLIHVHMLYEHYGIIIQHF